MKNNLDTQLQTVIETTACTEDVQKRFAERLALGHLTHGDDPSTHFVVYFLPYNPATRQVFIVYHKKSGLWISPGGHVEPGETLFEAVDRELMEELGYRRDVNTEIEPVMLTITPIKQDPRPCRTHYDVWFCLPTDGSRFNVDMFEFHETRWVSLAQARELVIDPNNLTALDRLEKLDFV